MYILSQRANATGDIFANYVFHACIHQRVVKNILPGYISIAWNTSFNRKSLDHVYEETTNSIEVGCL